jgi:cystathionine beta-lyase family protein involved in aluminum resistance
MILCRLNRRPTLFTTLHIAHFSDSKYSRILRSINNEDLKIKSQAVELGNRERLIAFCEVVQQTCPVGSFVKPTAGETPGYASEVCL